MKDFVFRQKTKVMYGEGIIRLVGNECKNLNAKKVFLITDPFLFKQYASTVIESISADGIEVGVFSNVQPEPGIEVVEEAAAALKDFGGDLVVALGGGSVMDTSKVVCVLQTNTGSARDYLYKKLPVQNSALPLICIPTTAGTGSEVTAVAVIIDKQANEKLGLPHESVTPQVAILDPQLHLTMTPELTATTGLDALCHAIEALVSTEAEPLSDALSIQAIRFISENIRKASSNGRDIETRGKMALASLMAGAGFAQVGLGLVHAIAQGVGGRCRIAHGLSVAIVLPYVIEFNLLANMDKFKNIAIALGENVDGLSLRAAASCAVDAVVKLKEDLGIPKGIKDIGVEEGDFAAIIKYAVNFPHVKFNPRSVSEADIRNILVKAYC